MSLRALLFSTTLLISPATSLAQDNLDYDALVQSVEAPPAPSPALPLPPHDDDALSAAHAFDARADYERAADAYEDYAGGCLESPMAILGADAACDETAEALQRAFELRAALSDAAGATRVAHAFTTHFLYAQPRAAIEIGYALAQMHVRRRSLEAAQAELEALIRLSTDPPAGLTLLTDALRAQIAAERAQPDRAARLWQRVERRFEREQDQLEADTSVPGEWVRQAVAEGRLQRAERSVTRFLETEPPRARGEASAAWWSRTMSPWLVRSRRRLLLARLQLERVYELGSPRHSVIAAARIGEMYQHRADLHARLSLPADDWVRTLVHQGSDRPGYEEARTHLETCVTWAAHHAVAQEWASRCETDLHTLDPHRYPVPAELHGRATYHPASAAPPSGPLR